MGLPEIRFHCLLVNLIWVFTCLEIFWKKSGMGQQTDQSLIQPLSMTQILCLFVCLFKGLVQKQHFSIKRKLFSENGNWQFTHWSLEETQISIFPLRMNSDIQGVGSADSTKIATCCWTGEEEARWDTYLTEEIWAASWFPMG